jgi:protease IV
MKKSVLPALAVLIMVITLVSCSLPLNKIAVISLSGTIQMGGRSSLFGGAAITPDDVRADLRKAANDPMVRAVVIRIDSPGGDPSACQEIVYEMERVKKPIVISMRSIATSGGYYISAKADKIVALPSTQTGSIGVISEMPDLKGLFDKIGVRMETVKAGKYKDMYAGMRALTDEEKALIQKNTDQIYEQFIDVVAEGRHMDKQKVRDLATGQIYLGPDAKDLGLVDEIGDLQKAIDIAAGLAGIKSPQTEFYEKQSPDLLKVLLGMNDSNVFNAGAGLLGAEGITALRMLENPYPVYLYK